MASVQVTISGTLLDKATGLTRPVVVVGEAFLTGLGVGGGPIIPPEQPVEPPLGIWGPPGPWPTPPINLVPQPRPEHPIVLPPDQVPPGMQPPTTPLPGDPTKPVPPPAGSPGWPVQPVVPPAYLVINYPGIGPVYVAPPASAQQQMAKK